MVLKGVFRLMRYKPKFAVLLAAKNGEKWIKKQIKSILSQKNVTVIIIIRIDDSSDKTVSICKEFEKKFTNIYIQKKNILKKSSPAKNFFSLIAHLNIKNLDYVAFSDQDDEWFDFKLNRAHKYLGLTNSSGYSSDVITKKINGKKRKLGKSTTQEKYDFLFESAGPGCTYVLRYKYFKILQNFVKQNFTQVLNLNNHDWFIYSFFRASGFKWYLDSAATMIYRQHESNFLGSNNNFKSYLKRLKMVSSKWYRNEVDNNFNLITKIAKKNLIFDVKKKNKCILNFYHLRRKKFDKFILLSFMLLGIY